MEKTSGKKDLPFLQVATPLPYRDDVLSALDSCDIFHFAGHGLTNSSDPSERSLVLRDGPLTVASLFEKKLHSHKPFLAYLSACGTGQVGHEELIDEGLHLIAACQLAGFQHVIGTLWSVNDKFCVDVAAETYGWMQQRGVSDESVSEGLRRASRGLSVSKRGSTRVHDVNQMAMEPSRSQAKAREPRDVLSCDETPLYWAPFVHFGV
ncbi:CHAT domain-containing protein [Lasiosphaeria ovina]|uniref:CHAT domain-containing protein n=1 Tax=Lasiosphaeria ovina TaxID=92902 RepID=A0AAE0KGC8_9PEZI|nr:CHAT domain-containing protein [Lasiosphaeria ovina]